MTQTRRLRSLMIWSVVCANIAVFLLSGYSLYRSRLQYESRAETLTQNAASAAAKNVANNIDKIDLALRTVADELERQTAGRGIDDKAMASFLAKQELRLPEVEAFRVVNANGLVVLGDVFGRETDGKWTEHDSFHYHRDHADNQMRVATPLIDHSTNLYVLDFTRRYESKDGSFAGIVAATVVVDNITLLLSGFDLGTHGTIYLRDASLALIARFPPIPNKSMGQIGNRLVSETARKSIATGERSATYRAAAADGFERIYSFKRIERTSMLIGAGMAREDYLAGWTEEAYKTLATAVLFLLLSQLFAAAFLRLLNAMGRESTRNEMYLQSASDGVQIWNAKENRIVEVNNRLCEVLGYTRDELLALQFGEWAVGWTAEVLNGRKLPEMLAASTPATIEMRLRRKDGALVDVEVSISNFYLEDVQYVYASYRDIRERKQAEQRILSLAHFDPLTHLPNRRLLIDRLSQALLASERSLEYGAMMILDLDNFKAINDTQGHDVGDRLLVEVARLVSACVRKEDTVARLGGDEYVVLVENLGRSEALASNQTEQIAEKIRNALNQAYRTTPDGQPYQSTASIGMTLFLGQSDSTDDLLKQADVALYQAKGAGRNAIRFFESRMQELIEARLLMEAALRQGLQQGELHLFYQPQVDHEQRLIGAEALLRWLPPDKAPVSPMEFIPLAEATGLIIPIGLWVMQTACAQLNEWSKNAAMCHLKLAINVSARQFRQPDFVEQLRESLERSGANPSLLKLELTESVVLEDLEDVINRMLQIKALGVTFSLDDFGTGFSSLSYLKRLPLDQVKIDQSFVRDVATDANDAAIVRAIIAMSRSLGMEVIAEGVETNEQLTFLSVSGCPNYQGYLFSRPLPPAQFETFVEQALRI
ncbi:PAS/PAC sensor-containing diguanylate cyclase/phosphodiesterase [Candidatus Propionivibrio aalborgensis]|uniref:PAS/PAC sensor-containing diguanylate cyclase/phosphodiesterase n=1 Tax=Candidatus Propionivibrio aalborgensis TaxID=1860101 RepID=A0A1A8Y236_9RHOO|nr:EAL domain-containing protein [Candidatus Propionivibrio aalborgensis]MBK7563614.1 EAL domain-containing protein [Propionivibrio sp.]MBK9028529.1 EAL domain-containing protein [Propionivibrio sp.]MBP6421371.1 EAL domain-containing protein [Propionivibrio sp.]SBT11200.1 PAS/PAC sensor-containing diguanylate cyclase/phosphodiesterase [Candidatus Propionivibrio aalborgensis]